MWIVQVSGGGDLFVHILLSFEPDTIQHQAYMHMLQLLHDSGLLFSSNVTLQESATIAPCVAAGLFHGTTACLRSSQMVSVPGSPLCWRGSTQPTAVLCRFSARAPLATRQLLCGTISLRFVCVDDFLLCGCWSNLHIRFLGYFV